jgi:hypothetical protein
LLALAACVRGGWHRRELVVGLVFASAFLFTTLGPIALVSQRYQFRDPLVLCAIPLAGMAAERGLQHARVRSVIAFLLVLQIAVLAMAAYPFVRRDWDSRRSATPWFRGATAAVPSADGLLSALERPGRVVYTPAVDRLVMNHSYLRAGLGVNALAYRGVPVVNGWFKGVSADPIWPNERLFYARIAPPPQLLTSRAALNVLGIRYLVAQRGETVAPDLRERPLAIPTAPELVLYENDDAWSGAVMFDAEGATVHAPPLADCPNDRLLCRDLSVVANLQPAAVAIVRAEGFIDVTFTRLDKPRTLVVAEMFRPGWTATTADQRLSTFAFFDSLLAVRVPAGATAVHFAYRSPLMYAATLGAWAAIIGSLFAAIRLSASRKWRLDRRGRITNEPGVA